MYKTEKFTCSTSNIGYEPEPTKTPKGIVSELEVLKQNVKEVLNLSYDAKFVLFGPDLKSDVENEKDCTQTIESRIREINKIVNEAIGVLSTINERF